MSNPDCFIGVDVAKSWIDVAWPGGQTLRLEHTPEAIAGLLASCARSRQPWW